MTRPGIILFDVMGTLVYDPFYRELLDFFGMTLDDLKKVKHPTAWVEFERGEIDEPTFYERFFIDGRPVDGPALKACLLSTYRFLPGVETLLAELQETGVAMHTLSNYPTWYRYIEETVGLSRYLPWTFVSCKTGVRKPDPEAYLGAARHLAVAPAECVFVDDRRKNCEAARGVGMSAIQFESVSALRRALHELGLLGAPD